MPERLLVGRIQRPHGLSGELSIGIQTDFPERFTTGQRLAWHREGDADRELVLTGVRPHGNRLLMTFEGIADPEGARALCGGDLFVPMTEAFPRPEGFFYSHEIQGFVCEDPQGGPLGSAAGVEQTPAGPLLAVTLPSGKEALVPFVEEFVLRIDGNARKIVLELPDGLLDL
ncbi:MAG: ribosome maturation factor RimM [Acidobacteriota bacterium]